MIEALPISATECERFLCACAVALVNKPEDWAAALDTVKGQHFQNDDWGRAWDVMVSLKRAGKTVATPIILAELRRGGLDRPGEILNEFLDVMPSSREMPHYAEQVVEAWRMRQIQDLGRRLYDGARNGAEGGADRLISSAAMRLSELQSEVSADSGVTLKQAMLEVVESKVQGNAPRIATGIEKLDAEIGGIPMGMFTLIAGRPGMGKSQLLKQILLNAAKAGVPSLLVTIEENRNKVAENALSNLSGVQNERIALNRLDVSELQLLEQWARECSLPLWIEDTQFSLSAVSRVVRKHVAKHGVKIVGIDYIQIIDSGARGENENREITILSQGIKRLARELGVAMPTAAQLNRAGAKDGERPKLTNLRGSGSLEQDGDLILLLHREDYYHADETGYIRTGLIEVDVAKNKFGRRQRIDLYFDGDHQRVF
jgi:replicative DNA helicase